MERRARTTVSSGTARRTASQKRVEAEISKQIVTLRDVSAKESKLIAEVEGLVRQVVAAIARLNDVEVNQAKTQDKLFNNWSKYVSG